MQLIQVLYRHDRGGPVDDITLDELIRSQKISHFYRPSEDKWVDILVDQLRGRGPAHSVEGLKRRYDDRDEYDEQRTREKTSCGLFRGMLMPLKKHSPRKAPTAEGWLERGFSALRVNEEYVGAARAFALSIRLDPKYQEAYLHRGLVYEALGNLQQAIEDYGMAVALDPENRKVHNRPGLVLGRPHVTVKAIAGLKRAADLQRSSPRTLLSSRAELREASEAPRERRREEKTTDAEIEGFVEVARDLQWLIDKYRKEITQLEADLGELKHKRNVLLEAARLVEEETYTPHRTLYENLYSHANKEKD